MLLVLHPMRQMLRELMQQLLLLLALGRMLLQRLHCQCLLLQAASPANKVGSGRQRRSGSCPSVGSRGVGSSLCNKVLTVSF